MTCKMEAMVTVSASHAGIGRKGRSRMTRSLFCMEDCLDGKAALGLDTEVFATSSEAWLANHASVLS